jgi:hypothetical protein
MEERLAAHIQLIAGCKKYYNKQETELHRQDNESNEHFLTDAAGAAAAAAAAVLVLPQCFR